jgi:predicted 3-demethylubiquinone-9 3-methyltransferase (glyoxalase superfamily)
MQKLTPFLWFDDRAEEAAKHYVSIFKNSKITQTERYGDAGPGPKGAAMTVAFELEGQSFIALNGGPQYKFTPAISFVANCTTQTEIDSIWEKLSSGGSPQPCGWVTDKFGLSWQVVPTILQELIHKPKVMQAMMQMSKLDIARLQQAAKE